MACRVRNAVFTLAFHVVYSGSVFVAENDKNVNLNPEVWPFLSWSHPGAFKKRSSKLRVPSSGAQVPAQVNPQVNDGKFQFPAFTPPEGTPPTDIASSPSVTFPAFVPPTDEAGTELIHSFQSGAGKFAQPSASGSDLPAVSPGSEVPAASPGTESMVPNYQFPIPPAISLPPRPIDPEKAPLREKLEEEQQQVRDDAVLFEELKKQRDSLKESNTIIVEQKRKLEEEHGKLTELAESGKKAQEELGRLRVQRQTTDDKLAKVSQAHDEQKQTFSAAMEQSKKLEQSMKAVVSERDALSAQIIDMSAENKRLYHEIGDSVADFNKTVLQLAAEKKNLIQRFTKLYRENQQLEKDAVKVDKEQKQVSGEVENLLNATKVTSWKNQQYHERKDKQDEARKALSKENTDLKTAFQQLHDIVKVVLQRPISTDEEISEEKPEEQPPGPNPIQGTHSPTENDEAPPLPQEGAQVAGPVVVRGGQVVPAHSQPQFAPQQEPPPAGVHKKKANRANGDNQQVLAAQRAENQKAREEAANQQKQEAEKQAAIRKAGLEALEAEVRKQEEANKVLEEEAAKQFQSLENQHEQQDTMKKQHEAAAAAQHAQPVPAQIPQAQEEVPKDDVGKVEEMAEGALGQIMNQFNVK